MAKIHAYLNFNGNCEEAFRFYAAAFKTEIISLMRFSDMPEDPNFPIPEQDKNKVLQYRNCYQRQSIYYGDRLLGKAWDSVQLLAPMPTSCWMPAPPKKQKSSSTPCP